MGGELVPPRSKFVDSYTHTPHSLYSASAQCTTICGRGIPHPLGKKTLVYAFVGAGLQATRNSPFY